MDEKRFKKCPCCGLWLSANEIINNPECRLDGLCLNENNSSLNLYVFTHLRENCATTFAILATVFDQFLREKPENSILAGTPACESHCLNIDDKSECGQKCFWAPYRRFMLKMSELKEEYAELYRPARL